MPHEVLVPYTRVANGIVHACGYASQLCCLLRPPHRFMSAARAHALLKDANNASADAFAAARTQRLLGHCLAGWTAAVVVGQSARSAAEELLQRVWMQLMVADWRTTTVCSRGFKAAVMVAWREAVLQQQAGGQRAACMRTAVSLMTAGNPSL